MNESIVLNDKFKMYYKSGMEAVDSKNYESARKNILLAAETLLKLAKLSEGSLKVQRVRRAEELIEFANKIAKKIQAVSSNDKRIKSTQRIINQTRDNQSLEDSLAELNSLIGLSSVKRQINDWIDQIKVFKLREKEGLPLPTMSYHLIFTGNPGTGKTTVARIIAQIYCALGITKTSNFVEVDRADLVAGYIGQTALKTKEVINNAKNGVLFIDEAYSLSNRGDSDFGQEAIDTLMKAMEDSRDDLVVIAAGYDDLMASFVDSNPGLKSRFKTIIHFDDYNERELFEIFMTFCNKQKYKLEAEAIPLLKKIINYIYINRRTGFGNGRDMRNLFENVITAQSKRIAAMTSNNSVDKNELSLIKCEDLPLDLITKDNDVKVELKNKTRKPIVNEEKTAEEEIIDDNKSDPFNSDFAFDWNSLPVITFEDVAGLDTVKEEVRDKVLLPLTHPEIYSGYNKKNGGGLLLYGPPGTGKTMIAAAIANEIGAKFCSVKPSDLLHQGAGNTEKAVRTLFAQARQFPCAIIFFDEMDSIAQKNTRSSYAKQLRSELLAQLQGTESYGKETGNILYLIAATNKPWDVDSAFLRPGRFGTRIFVSLPDDEARKYMIEKSLNDIRENGEVEVMDDIDVFDIVGKTKGFNGSDITNLLEKVKEISIKRTAIQLSNPNNIEINKYISGSDFEEAFETIKSTVQREDIERLINWTKENNII